VAAKRLLLDVNSPLLNFGLLRLLLWVINSIALGGDTNTTTQGQANNCCNYCLHNSLPFLNLEPAKSYKRNQTNGSRISHAHTITKAKKLKHPPTFFIHPPIALINQPASLASSAVSAAEGLGITENRCLSCAFSLLICKVAASR